MHENRLIALISVASLACAPQSEGQDLSSRADSVVRAAALEGFSGVVRVEQNGKVILEKGYGLADRAARIPFDARTVVQIGSNTKDFTAVAILQLAERGRLTLDDPITRFFPDAPADKRAITVHHLLEHEAGFPLGLGGDFERRSRDELVTEAMRFKLLFEPGSKRSYSNTGYSLLAAIIEQMSGTSYDEYVRTNILNPIGLTDTGFHLPRFDDRRLAHGYRSGGEDAGTMLSRGHASDGPWWNLRGNGGMLSTVGDMSRFYKALFETDSLLKPASRRGGYNPREPVLLAGSDLVSMFMYERDPEAELEIIIASNNAEYRANRLLRELHALLIPPGARPRVVEGGPAPLVRREGKAAAPAIAAIVTELVETLNEGDSAALHAFVSMRFAAGEGAPTVEERMQRIGGLHRAMGRIEILTMTAADEGPVEVIVRSAKEGEALLVLDIDRAPPHMIRRMGVQVGGG